jgi:hypothetical protein
MTEPAARRRWRPSPTSLVAGGVILAAALLSELSWWFVGLAGLGAFGPGVLRELGWLRDKDEFQLRAAHRAGYHAFLTAGLTAFVLIGLFRSAERSVKDPEELATLFLALLWFSWLLSSLLAYWGPQKTARRILYIFGTCWLLFNVVSNLDSFEILFMQVLFTAVPFFVLAWMTRRWPRVTGVLLLTAAGSFFWFFRLFRREHMGLITDGVVFILFLGPLIASGVALLGGEKDADDAESSETDQADEADEEDTPITPRRE